MRDALKPSSRSFFTSSQLPFLLYYQSKEKFCIPMVFNLLLALTLFLKLNITYQPGQMRTKSEQQDLCQMSPHPHPAKISEELAWTPGGCSEGS